MFDSFKWPESENFDQNSTKPTTTKLKLSNTLKASSTEKSKIFPSSGVDHTLLLDSITGNVPKTTKSRQSSQNDEETTETFQKSTEMFNAPSHKSITSSLCSHSLIEEIDQSIPASSIKTELDLTVKNFKLSSPREILNTTQAETLTSSKSKISITTDIKGTGKLTTDKIFTKNDKNRKYQDKKKLLEEAKYFFNFKPDRRKDYWLNQYGKKRSGLKPRSKRSLQTGTYLLLQ